MKQLFFYCFALLFGLSAAKAQALKLRGDKGGILSIGARTSFSLFGDSNNAIGTGIGGQFRLQLHDRINTDWFADYITTDIQGLAHRTDYHIGWSVLYYPYLSGDKKRFQAVLPYISAGHCFDFTRVVENQVPSNSQNRFSAAVQAGVGAHFHLSQRLDLTLNVLYMIHFGQDVHVEVENGLVHIEKTNGGSIEGHLLPTLSVSYKLIDLWGRKE